MDKTFEIKLNDKSIISLKKNDFDELGTIYEFSIKFKTNNFLIISFYDENLKVIDQSQILLLSDQPTHFNDNYLVIFTSYSSNAPKLNSSKNYENKLLF